MGQPGDLERRSDIVEHDRLQDRGSQHPQNVDDQATTRSADEGGLLDLQLIETCQDVVGFDAYRIVGDIAVIGGLAPPAIVE